jgi:flagellar hook-length control protein FliK
MSVMPIQPNIRLAASADTASPMSADAATGSDEPFNELVAGLAGAKRSDASGVEGEPTPDADATPAGHQDVAAAVEQLLALVAGHAPAQAGKGKSKPGAEPDEKGPAADTASGTDTAPANGPTPVIALAIAAPTPIAAQDVPVPTTPVAATVPQAAARLPGNVVSAPAADTDAAPEPDSASPTPATPVASRSDTPQPARSVDPAPLQAMVKSLLAEIGFKGADKPATAERSHAIQAASMASVTDTSGNAQPAFSTSAPLPQNAATADTAPAQPLQGQVIERQLDLAHQQDWIDQLAKDIAGAAGGDGKALRFRLNPENLGSLHVEIAQSHHGAAVRISADTESARTIIADAQQRLVSEARAQGVRISETHVDLGGGSPSGDPRRQAARLPDEAPVRTARSLREDEGGDGKPTPRQTDLYA